MSCSLARGRAGVVLNARRGVVAKARGARRMVRENMFVGKWWWWKFDLRWWLMDWWCQGEIAQSRLGVSRASRLDWDDGWIEGHVGKTEIARWMEI